MPPASANAVNNNANNNNAAALKAERLREALKAFVLKEHQRKKEELEAKVREEHLRKEREARERQNDMTLEETRGQISKLDQKITDLRNQKQQLFLQLKKVLNEDENRKKQQKASVPPPQVFIPPVRVQHHQMPILPKPVGNQPVKRGRSPSPPPHPGYYKSTNYTQPKHDDGRRAADLARLLWNKTYPNTGPLFYQTTSNAPPPQPPPDARGPPIIYPPYHNIPIRQGYHLELQPTSTVPVSKSDQQPPKPAQVYHINLDQPPNSQAGPGSSGPPDVQLQKPQVTMEKINDRYHVEVKHDGASGHIPPHQLPETVLYIPQMLHPNVMQISGNPGPNPKTGGSITQGYGPGRGATSAHEQHLARQQQLMQGQPGQQPQQPLSYSRRLY